VHEINERIRSHRRANAIGLACDATSDGDSDSEEEEAKVRGGGGRRAL